jgi:hypothetical protein
MYRRFGTLCSIFTGVVSRKNNREEIARVYLVPAFLPSYTTYEDGKDRVFRNFGTKSQTPGIHTKEIIHLQ